MTTEQIAGHTTYRSSIDELHHLLPGKVVAPGDAEWEAARTPWGVNIDQQPHAVVTVDDAADVVTALRFARLNGLAVAAQPGGHGSTRALEDTILLRTRGLDGIEVDVAARVARVGAGVKWGELLTALDGTGLTGLAGSTPDSLVALEIVNADGEVARVTAETDPDLFWAIRGRGGDFGIITAAEVALHPAATVYGGRLMWPMEHAAEVLRALQTVTASAPDELTV